MRMPRNQIILSCQDADLLEVEQRNDEKNGDQSRVRGKCGKLVNLPALCPDIERVSSICILGVTVNDQLSAADHVVSLLASSKNLLYAMRVLRVHGIPDVSLQEVFRATLLAKMTYAGSA